jgi:hypothetical protein
MVLSVQQQLAISQPPLVSSQRRRQLVGVLGQHGRTAI